MTKRPTPLYFFNGALVPHCRTHADLAGPFGLRYTHRSPSCCVTSSSSPPSPRLAGDRQQHAQNREPRPFPPSLTLPPLSNKDSTPLGIYIWRHSYKKIPFSPLLSPPAAWFFLETRLFLRRFFVCSFPPHTHGVVACKHAYCANATGGRRRRDDAVGALARADAARGSIEQQRGVEPACAGAASKHKAIGARTCDHLPLELGTSSSPLASTLTTQNLSEQSC